MEGGGNNDEWTMDPSSEELVDLVLVDLKAKSKLWLEIKLLKERTKQEKKRPHDVTMISC